MRLWLKKVLTYCTRLACTIKSKVDHSSIFKFSNSSFREIMFYVQKNFQVENSCWDSCQPYKRVQYFQPTILVSMCDSISELVYVCTVLRNFSSPFFVNFIYAPVYGYFAYLMHHCGINVSKCRYMHRIVLQNKRSQVIMIAQ